MCGKTPVIILTCKKSPKHFKTRKNLLLYEVILPFYSRQQYVQIRVTTETGFAFSITILDTVVTEMRLHPGKKATDHSALVSLGKCSEF